MPALATSQQQAASEVPRRPLPTASLSALQSHSLFYVLNLYRQAFVYHNMGYASAMAWVLFVIVLGLTVLIFRASRNLVYYEGLKA